MRPSRSIPDLSVVIPAYNEEARIRRAVLEVVNYLTQENLHFEMIVVDDGSTDDTVQEVKALSRTYPMVRLLSLWPNREKGRPSKWACWTRKGILFFLRMRI